MYLYDVYARSIAIVDGLNGILRQGQQGQGRQTAGTAEGQGTAGTAEGRQFERGI